MRARLVVDASGRRRVLGGARRRTSPRTLALHACWRGASDKDADTLVEARPDRWLWGAHLPGGGFRAMVFVDPARLRRRELGARYRELVLAAPLFAEVLADAAIEGEVDACDATCYAAEEPLGAVGEAAFAIDPLSSSGVQTAIQTGVAAAVAVHSILAGERAAAEAYLRDSQRHAVERHALLAARTYAECGAYAGEPFWRRRAAAPPAPVVRAPLALDALLTRRVRLAPGAALATVPCVVGDRVSMRRALTDASLARPVAFLGDHELAPLLDRLAADQRPLGDVVQAWGPAALPVAGWLASRGLLEARLTSRQAPDAQMCTGVASVGAVLGARCRGVRTASTEGGGVVRGIDRSRLEPLRGRAARPRDGLQGDRQGTGHGDNGRSCAYLGRPWPFSIILARLSWRVRGGASIYCPQRQVDRRTPRARR